MNLINEKCARIIIDELGIRGKFTAKCSESFWNFIGDELIKSGKVEIPKLGTFILKDTDDANYAIDFCPDEYMCGELGAK